MSTDRTDSTAVAEVVVGVDGSEPSTRALIWAMDVARRYGWSVDVVTAWPDAGSVLVHEVPGHFSLPRHRADEAQRTALMNALLAVDSPPVVETHLVNARPVTALSERAATAQVLVVGSHGVDRPSDHRHRTPIGEALTLLVPCPVVVVEPRPPPAGPVSGSTVTARERPRSSDGTAFGRSRAGRPREA